jgi:hypothetical protein
MKIPAGIKIKDKDWVKRNKPKPSEPSLVEGKLI